MNLINKGNSNGMDHVYKFFEARIDKQSTGKHLSKTKPEKKISKSTVQSRNEAAVRRLRMESNLSKAKRLLPGCYQDLQKLNPPLNVNVRTSHNIGSQGITV